MSTILYVLYIGFLFFILIFFLNFFLSEKLFFLKSKQMSFECGIENMFSPRIPFSIQFFMICVIFILFDIEVIILFNLIFKTFFIKFFLVIIFILFFVFLTFMMEWKMKSLDWKF